MTNQPPSKESSDKLVRPRILYVVPSAGIGGAETFILQVAKYSRNTAPVFALLRQGPLFDQLRQYDHPIAIAQPTPRLSRPWKSWQTLKWLEQWSLKNHCQLVHSTMSYGALFGAEVAKRRNLPHLWYQHGPVSGWKDLAAAFRQPELLLTNSKYTLEEQRKLEKRWRLSSTAKILTLGVDLEAFSSKGSKESQNPFLATMLCRPQSWKGIHLFIDALTKVQKEAPVVGRFVGGSANLESANDYERGLRQQVLRRGVNFEFAGTTNRPREKLMDSQVLVNASTTTEPFGLSIIEAMAMGVVPVAPRAGGPQEIIEEKKNGLLFEPGNSTDLAEKILWLHRNPVQRKEMSLEARRSVQNRFNAEVTVQNLETISTELIKDKTKASS